MHFFLANDALSPSADQGIGWPGVVETINSSPGPIFSQARTDVRAYVGECRIKKREFEVRGS